MSEVKLEAKESSNFSTIFEMKNIILRCLNEAEKAGYIIKEVPEHQSQEPKRILLNEDMVADHISKTLIGELLEFEIIRKLAPILRGVRYIEKELHFIDQKQAIEDGIPNLRIGPR